MSLLEHGRDGGDLVESIVGLMVTIRRRWEWFGHVKIRNETEDIGTVAVVLLVAEMKIEGKRPGGRPRLRWKETVKRHEILEHQGGMGH